MNQIEENEDILQTSNLEVRGFRPRTARGRPPPTEEPSRLEAGAAGVRTTIPMTPVIRNYSYRRLAGES